MRSATVADVSVTVIPLNSQTTVRAVVRLQERPAQVSSDCAPGPCSHAQRIKGGRAVAISCPVTSLLLPRLLLLLVMLNLGYAADCGAGVGRVSEQLLLHHFHIVDMLEPSKHLIDAAQKNLKAAVASGSYPAGHAIGQCFCQGLQEFNPEPQRCVRGDQEQGVAAPETTTIWFSIG